MLEAGHPSYSSRRKYLGIGDAVKSLFIRDLAPHLKGKCRLIAFGPEPDVKLMLAEAKIAHRQSGSHGST
jgi:hypothetical protein